MAQQSASLGTMLDGRILLLKSLSELSVYLTQHYKATSGLLATDLIILNQGQAKSMTPKCPLLLISHYVNGRTLSLERFNMPQPQGGSSPRRGTRMDSNS
ncbi:hypothetical protein TNCV_3419781 [Trichonephila clavipes]|nr:hypothetical protein TNCV_3419781 [Trichonephila clavipes]